MRISTGQIYTSANRNMMDNQGSLLDIQDKLASGKEFTSLAEDPVGASQVVSLNRELAQLDMYQTNVESSRRRLELEETTLDNLNTAMDRMRELMLQAANGTLTDADRVSLSYELDDLVNYSAGLMNTRDAKGEYLFSGSQGSTETYTLENGRYAYQGDSSTRSIQISSALYIESTDSGQFLFESITEEPELGATGELASAITGYEVTDADKYASLMRSHGDLELRVSVGDDGSGAPLPGNPIYRYALLDSAGLPVKTAPPENLPVGGEYDPTDPDARMIPVELSGITLELELPDNTFTNDPAVTVDDQNSEALSATPAISNFQLYTELMYKNDERLQLVLTPDDPDTPTQFTVNVFDANGDPAVDETGATLMIPAIPVAVAGSGGTSTVTLGAGLSVDVSADPNDYPANGDPVKFSLDFEPPATARLTYEQEQSNILNTMLDTIDALRNLSITDSDAKAELKEQMATAITHITTAQERVSEATAKVGARLNTLDNAEFSNTDFKLMTEATLSSIQDLDYAAASTELAKRQLALEAAYASFAKIQGLSLFDYIR